MKAGTPADIFVRCPPKPKTPREGKMKKPPEPKPRQERQLSGDYPICTVIAYVPCKGCQIPTTDNLQLRLD